MSVTEEIKSRLDIVDIVSETVSLRKSGRNYAGFCPFHSNTRTPAFYVFPETQTWRCFGACAEGGDLFSYKMKKEGWDFREALEQMARLLKAPVAELPERGPFETILQLAAQTVDRDSPRLELADNPLLQSRSSVGRGIGIGGLRIPQVATPVREHLQGDLRRQTVQLAANVILNLQLHGRDAGEGPADLREQLVLLRLRNVDERRRGVRLGRLRVRGSCRLLVSVDR